MINGLINVYKEPGYTSHDVVARLRGILKQKKIGHTGTLDPAAQGVLPVCLGTATKLCDMLTDRTKTYRAVLLLGRDTDTQDTTGETVFVDEAGALALDEERVREAVMGFLGDYDQIPPHVLRPEGGRQKALRAGQSRKGSGAQGAPGHDLRTSGGIHRASAGGDVGHLLQGHLHPHALL